MSFWSKYIQGKADDLRDAAEQQIVTHDPQGAIRASIAQQKTVVSQCAAAVVEAEDDVATDQHNLDEMNTRLANMIKVVEAFQDKPEKAQVVAEALAKGEALKTQIAAQKERLEKSQAYLQQCKDDHQAAVTKLETEEQSLQDALRALKTAEHDAEREKRRLAQAEAAQGIAGRSDRSDVALDALKSRTQTLERQARGQKLTTTALRHGHEGDDALEAAVKEVTTSDTGAAAGGSIADRLAALKG